MEDEEAYYRTPEDEPDSWAVAEWRNEEWHHYSLRPAPTPEGHPDLLYRIRETDHRRSGAERRTRTLIAECDRRMPGWDRRQS